MSNKLQILIIEDELSSVNKLSDYLAVLRPDAEVKARLRSVSESRAWLEQNPHPDIIFLDIQLSDGLSFQIFEDLEIQSQVIFLTAYEQYAIRAFEVNSIDYVLKPFDEQAIQASLEKYERKTEQVAGMINRSIPWSDLKVSSRKSRFMVKRGNMITSVPIADIAYFFKDNVVFLVTHTGEKYVIDYTLEQLESLLNMETFFRLNRQFICSFKCVKTVDRINSNRLRANLDPTASHEVIISQNKSASFKAWLNL